MAIDPHGYPSSGGAGLLPLTPERLHGRDDHHQTLRAAFGRIRQGASELVLLTGPAGIGKTVLAESLGEPVEAHGGLFARGWFDPFHGTPLSGFRHALRGALRSYLGRPAADRVACREALQDALGDGAGVVAQLVPELEHVIGAVPEPSPALSSEGQNRFRLLIRRLIGALASADAPLVLLMDDLQWAEPSSLALLSDLAQGPPLDHVLIVGGLRSEAVGDDHPLLLLAADPPAGGMPIRRVELEGLGQPVVRSLVADALRMDDETIGPLADAATHAAGGNPLSLLRFLGVLHDSAALRRNPADDGWEWDHARLEQQALRRGSRALLERVLDRMPEISLRTLEAAACLAGEFTTGQLALGLGVPGAEVVVALQPAVEGHLLRPVGEAAGRRDSPQRVSGAPAYRFVHARIRDALYHRIPEDARRRSHSRLGHRLMAAWRQQPGGELLFDAADQLLRADELGAAPTARADVASLFAAAGETANRTAAWHRAVAYLEAARSHRPADDGDLGWRIRSALATAYSMCGRVADGEETLDRAATDAEGLVRQVAVTRMRSQMRVLDNRYADAVEAGIDGLALLGHVLPSIDDAETWAVPSEAEVLRMAALMSDTAVEQLTHHPPMTDERAAAELALLCEILAPAYLFPHVLSWAITRSVNLCLEHGNGDGAPLAYAMQGMLCCMGGDTEVGNALGRLALDLAELREDRVQEVQATLMFVNFIDHWTHPLEDGFDRGLAAIDTALEQGLFQWAGWLAMNAASNQFNRGEPLARLVDQNVDLYRMARDTARYDDAAHFLAVVLHVGAELAGRIDVTRLLDDRGASPRAMVEALAHYPVAAVNARISILIGACISGDRRAAGELVREIRDGLGAALGLPQPMEFALYESLVVADEHADAGPERQREIEDVIEANLTALRGWNAGCPANHAHKLAFLEAELLALRGEDPTDTYATAARLAARRRYTQVEGLAWERRGAFLRARGRTDEALDDEERAKEAYRTWGALAKVDALSATNGKGQDSG